MSDVYAGTVEQFEKFYNDTVAETREQVAQEIEARSTGEDKVVWMNDALKNCAAIARGQK